jgi:hypothetical protein
LNSRASPTPPPPSAAAAAANQTHKDNWNACGTFMHFNSSAFLFPCLKSFVASTTTFLQLAL